MAVHILGQKLKIRGSLTPEECIGKIWTSAQSSFTLNLIRQMD